MRKIVLALSVVLLATFATAAAARGGRFGGHYGSGPRASFPPGGGFVGGGGHFGRPLGYGGYGYGARPFGYGAGAFGLGYGAGSFGYYGYRAWPYYGSSFGVFVGAPLVVGGVSYGLPYYGYPYYVSPTIVATAPPVYIQQPQRAEDGSDGNWYYCSNPQGYYPTVSECPGGWTPVPAQ